MSKCVIMLSTYNGQAYLDRQLESIFLQNTSINIQMIIRDDGSTDNTIHIINKWKKKIHIILIEDGCSLGAAKSFWKLLHEAPDADFYAFVDQDDVWDVNKIEKAIASIGNIREKILWFSNCRVISDDDTVLENRMHKVAPFLEIPSQLICGSAQGCSMVFNHYAFEYLKTLELACIPMHDIVIMEYILASGNVLYEDMPMFGYRVHPNNAIAKEGKCFYKKVKNSINQWFGKNNIYLTSTFASQVLKDNRQYLTEDVVEYLTLLMGCRNSLKNRIKIIKSPLTRTTNSAALRSFKAKVLLGII